MVGQLGQGRVGVRGNIVRGIERVQTVHADKKNMLDLLSIAKLIVGASRWGKVAPTNPIDIATAINLCFKRISFIGQRVRANARGRD